MGKPGKTGIARVLDATVYSFKGLTAALRNEAAFRQELALFLLLVPLALYLADNLYDSLVLIASALFVLVVELINSAIETTVDRIGSEHHELSGRAKDMGSAAVLLSIIACACIWIAVLYG